MSRAVCFLGVFVSGSALLWFCNAVSVFAGALPRCNVIDSRPGTTLVYKSAVPPHENGESIIYRDHYFK